MAIPTSITADQDLIDKFLEICRQNNYRERTNVIVPGDEANSLYYVMEGNLSIAMPGEDDRDYILSYLNPGDFIGELGLFIPSHQREVVIQSRTPCKLAKVSYERLWEALDNELQSYALEFLKFIAKKVSLRLHQSNRRVLTLSSLDVQGRIARTLIELSRQPNALHHSQGIEIKITREELSRLVGCSRELSGKTLKVFAERGMIITKGRSIIIPDENALEF